MNQYFSSSFVWLRGATFFTAVACSVFFLMGCEPKEKAVESTRSDTQAEQSQQVETATEATVQEEGQANTNNTEAEVGAASLLKVEDPWVRVAVEGQSGTGGFLKITPNQDLELVGFVSDEAEVNEIHEMVMDGDVMKMSAIPSLPLPANTTTELKPGSYHLMLMKLKKPLLEGENIQLTLKVKDKNAVVSTFPIVAKIKSGGNADEKMKMHGNDSH